VGKDFDVAGFEGEASVVAARAVGDKAVCASNAATVALPTLRKSRRSGLEMSEERGVFIT